MKSTIVQKIYDSLGEHASGVLMWMALLVLHT